MAHIWHREERGTWMVDYTDATGRRRRLTARTEEDAQILLAEKLRERRDPRPTISSDITIAEYAAQWLRSHVAQNLKHATRRNYRWSIETIVIPALGSVKLRELRRPHVKWLLAEKREAGLAKTSVHSIRGALSSMLSAAVDDEIVPVNVALSTGRRRKGSETQSAIERRESMRPFTEAEAAALIAAGADHESRTFLMLQARAGLRPGEAMGLKWSDLDFSKREILIERAWYEGVLGTTKTGESRRVDMSGDLAKALTALYVQREREQLQGKYSEIPEWAFCDRAGKPLTRGKLDGTFSRAMRRAGLSGHTLYDLRHTFASTLLAKGIPLTYVAKQLGHSKPTTTLRYYAHWLPSGDQRFVDTLDQAPATPAFVTNFVTKKEKPLSLQRETGESALSDI